MTYLLDGVKHQLDRFVLFKTVEHSIQLNGLKRDFRSSVSRI